MDKGELLTSRWTWKPRALERFPRSHGPHAPCPSSPTGDHCWHDYKDRPAGTAFSKRCCHCGKASG